MNEWDFRLSLRFLILFNDTVDIDSALRTAFRFVFVVDRDLIIEKFCLAQR